MSEQGHCSSTNLLVSNIAHVGKFLLCYFGKKKKKRSNDNARRQVAEENECGGGLDDN